MNEIKNDKYWIRQQDNLEFMKELESESIDLIYNDILFSTGKKFKDYDDNLWKHPNDAMEWYKPRLIEMKRILKDTGSIYLQCDYRLVHYLKVLMDEIFGINNFKNDIIWNYKRWTMKSENKWQNMHDNILFYGINNKVKEITEKIDKPKKQNKNDGNGKSLRGEDGKILYHIQTERLIDDVWNIPILNPKAKERLGFATQKPKALLERIIKASSNEGNVVADFFAGSHTTGEVAVEIGRYYIGCDIGDRSFEIGRGRLSNE